MSQGSRLNLWFRLRNVEGRRVVSLTTAMNVQEVFFAIQLAFGLELLEKSATKITLTLPHHDPNELMSL